MRLVSLYLENFMAHKKQLFTFTKEGPYVILGQNLDDNGKSNGCGKSSIFAGISLALYNQTRSKTLSQAISSGEKYMKVILVLQKKDKYYRITRNRRKDGTSSTTLETASDEAFAIDAEDITGHNQDETQVRIVNLMRMDYHGFCNSLYFKEKAADIFADSTRGARFEIIKNSLGVDLYDKIGKEAKKDADALAEEMHKSSVVIDAATLNAVQIEKFEDELEIDNDTLRILQAELEEIEKEIAEFHRKKGSIGQVESSLRQAKTDLETVRRSHGGLVNKRQGLVNTKQDYDGRLTGARTELAGLKKEMDELKALKASTPLVADEDIENLTTKISDLNSTRSGLMQDIIDAEEAIKTMQSKSRAQHASSCPTCRQELSKAARDGVVKACQATIIAAKEQSSQATKDIQMATAERQLLITRKNTLTDAANRIASITERASSVKQVGEHYKEAAKQAELECQAIDGDISELLERKATLEKTILELDNTISSVVKADESSLTAKKNANSNKIAEIHRTIGIKTQTIEQLKSSIPDDIEDIKNKIKDLWVKREVNANVLDSCSKKGGIPSVLIAQAITEIELYTNQMLSGFTFECADMNVKLMMSKPDEIDIQVRKANESEFRDFDSFSGGERFIVSFAIRIALSNILSNKYGADVRFILLDEAGMQLDEYNNGLFAAMIKRLAKDRLILLITHQNILKEHISQTILIRRSNGKSEVLYS